MAQRTVSEINQALKKDARGFIEACEKEFEEKLDVMVRKIEEGRKKVVLLAGPSASGKTTTANLLADRLRARGHFAAVVSLDDFYYNKNDPRYPKTPEGEPDFESPYALWIEGIRHTIADIIDGGGNISLPHFDFKEGVRIDNAVHLKVPADGVVVIEGLHALNPIMTQGIVTDAVVRVFVSVSTNLYHEGEQALSGRKMRFIRRLSRDYLYRASDVERTFSMWHGVRRGENQYLYPFKELADISFDTFHGYEVAVLKPFAAKILSEGRGLGEYVDKVADGLGLFKEITPDLVPETSLIREFMPGGVYEHLY